MRFFQYGPTVASGAQNESTSKPTSKPLSKPLVTANQVTVARLIPLPACAWMLYQSDGWVWVAFVVGMLVAMTDFIDGYLARKHGPTILGGLLDPIADKVFISAFFLPLVDLALVPAWTVAALFVREFLVTGIRSAYAQRGMSMKTSYFGKVKTWVQMQAIGYMMLVLLLPPKQTLLIVTWGIVGGAAILTAVVSLKRKRLFVSGIIMMIACAFAAILYWKASVRTTLAVTMYVTVAVTWLSGFDYLFTAFAALRNAGDFARADFVRVLGAILMPILGVMIIVYTSAPIAPILVLIALELAVGGLDNLLSHHQVAANAIRWGARALGASVLLGAALLLTEFAPTINANVIAALVWAAMAVSLWGVAHEFWNGRDIYLDDKLADAPA